MIRASVALVVHGTPSNASKCQSTRTARFSCILALSKESGRYGSADICAYGKRLKYPLYRFSRVMLGHHNFSSPCCVLVLLSG